MEKQVHTEDKKEKRRVMWFSIALHTLVILLLFMPWFNASAKQDPDQLSGILVQFALDEGAASSKASTSKSKPEVPPKKEIKEEKAVATKPSKAVKVESENRQEKSDVVAVKEKVTNKDDAAEKARAEANKKAAEEAAKKAAEEAEAKKQAEYESSKSKFSGLFGSGASDKKDGTTESGNPDGDPDASKLDGLTSGTGSVGNGLGGRRILFEPTIKDNSQKSGKVVIRVCVGPDGDVISKKFTQLGSTTTDSHLVDLALKNVSKYKFNKSEIPKQCGDIVIDFKLK